jgi:hypothetical protein
VHLGPYFYSGHTAGQTCHAIHVSNQSKKIQDRKEMIKGTPTKNDAHKENHFGNTILLFLARYIMLYLIMILQVK